MPNASAGSAWEAAVGGDLVHLVGVEHLEDGREEVEAVAPGVALDLLLDRAVTRGESC